LQRKVNTNSWRNRCL